MVLAMFVDGGPPGGLRDGRFRFGRLKSQMKTAQQIAKIEKQIDAKQQEMDGLLQQYVQQGGQNVGSIVGQGLTPDQKQVLEARLKNEQGIGYGDLVWLTS